MQGTKLVPEKITSPIQLMAAWFAMLILLVSVLLTAAVNISKPDWGAGFLVIFASVVTVLVISCVTLMLTVFRPHLQEGKEYAQWLKDKNTYSPGLIVQEEAKVKRVPLASKVNVIAALQIDKSLRVSVSGQYAGADELIKALRLASFQVEEYETKRLPPPNRPQVDKGAAIWIGARVQAAAAVEAIKLAITIWPHLRYMHLSTDGDDPPDEVHDELFLGGATSTAMSFGLQPWTLDEIRAIPANISEAEFHRAIRAKYS